MDTQTAQPALSTAEQPKSIFSFLSGLGNVLITAHPVSGDIVTVRMRIVDGGGEEAVTDLLGYTLGSIRVDQRVINLTGSFLNSRNRVAFISGRIDLLNQLVAHYKWVAGSVIPGKIVVLESLTPWWPNQEAKINPSTMQKIGVQVGESFHPVYMKMEYRENLNAPDHFIRSIDDVVNELARQKMSETPANVVKETAAIPTAKATQPAGAEE